MKDRELFLTQNSLQQAFDAPKHQPALSADNDVGYGATRVIDVSDLGLSNPMHARPPKQHVELVEQKPVKKIAWADIRKMSGGEYVRALQDSDLGPQIEESFYRAYELHGPALSVLTVRVIVAVIES